MSDDLGTLLVWGVLYLLAFAWYARQFAKWEREAQDAETVRLIRKWKP